MEFKLFLRICATLYNLSCLPVHTIVHDLGNVAKVIKIYIISLEGQLG